MINTSIYNRYSPAFFPDSDEDKPVWFFVFNSDKLLIKITNDTFTVPVKCTMEDLKLRVLTKYYLGKLDGCDCYCIETDDQVTVPEGMFFKKFISLLGRIDEEMFMLAGRAYQILSWDKKSQYCGSCGSKNEIKHDERAKVCPKCSEIVYPKISPAVIVAVVNGNKILLAHAKHFKENLYSLIAGFVEPGEAFEDCVKREVFEEVGLALLDPLQIVTSSYFFIDTHQTPVIDVIFYCLLKKTNPSITASAREVSHFAWMSLQEILAHEKSPIWLKRYISALLPLREQAGS